MLLKSQYRLVHYLYFNNDHPSNITNHIAIETSVKIIADRAALTHTPGVAEFTNDNDPHTHSLFCSQCGATAVISQMNR